MPNAYVGDKANTQAPSIQPQPDGPITVNLPADGDPPNASTFIQGYKVLADFVDFLLRPTAKASDWLNEIMAWRTGLGHRRFAVDHLGLPSGRVFSYDPAFLTTGVGGDGYNNGTSAGANFGTTGWTYRALQTSGLSSVVANGNSFGPGVNLLSGDTVDDFAMIYTSRMGACRTDNHVVFEAQAFGTGTLSRNINAGVFDGFAGAGLDSASVFMGFRAGPTLNWECVTRVGGVETATPGPAAPAPSSSHPQRLRAEWHGEGVSDNGVRAVRFYIDGALVATHTTNLPLNMEVCLGISDRRASLGASGVPWQVGAVRLRTSLHHGDTVL